MHSPSGCLVKYIIVNITDSVNYISSAYSKPPAPWMNKGEYSSYEVIEMLKIIISPAKKMNLIDEFSFKLTDPVFLEETGYLHTLLKGMPLEELQTLWQCSDRLAKQNYERLHSFSPNRASSPALLAYEGIQYQYMAPQVFSDSQWDYVSDHLYILSGFYGILKPADRVIPYRLEMQAKLETEEARDLYRFWGSRMYDLLTGKDGESDSVQILNLASAEYSKTILPYVRAPHSQVTCIFGEIINGKVKMKGTQAKMARGEMVRWMSEQYIENISEIRRFDRLDYRFHPELSSETEYVFLKNPAPECQTDDMMI